MFERFTGDARTAVVLAQVQARDLGHDYIGTEHLLLALLATESSGLRATLAALGVTDADVKEEIVAIVGRGEGAGSGHIPFTPRSKKVLELSLREALALKHTTIQPQHILLGLLREGEGLATQILFKRGVDLGRLRQTVLTSLPPGTGSRRSVRRMFSSAGASPPMTVGAAHVADRAARRAGAAPVASQHYLLGLLDDDQSLAAKALAALGVTTDDVEAKLAELGTRGTSDEPPEQWGARHTTLAAEADLVTVQIADADLAMRIRRLYEQLHVRVLQGPDVLPTADRLWLAVHPAVEEAVVRLEDTAAVRAPAPDRALTWQPPGWSDASVATYAVVSKPGGPTTQVWTAKGVDPDEVRAFLADWLVVGRPEQRDDAPVLYISVSVSRARDIVPDASHPDRLVVSAWSTGAGGPLIDWPRLPVAVLVEAAVADLTEDPAS